MIATVLIAVDDSVRAPVVVRSALELVDRFAATAHLFRAVHLPQEFPAAAHVASHDDLPTSLRDHAFADLQRLAGGHPRIVVEPPLVAPVPPWRAILDAADRLSADLIVLGSHGYHGLDRILGTTAGKVADHAHRNVFIVHDGAHG